MEPVRSCYEDDPDMLELVREFARELPDRALALERALAAADRALLGTLAHQLKGAGGGYGFAAISERAAGLESALARDLGAREIERRARELCAVLRAVIAPEGP